MSQETIKSIIDKGIHRYNKKHHFFQQSATIVNDAVSMYSIPSIIKNVLKEQSSTVTITPHKETSKQNICSKFKIKEAVKPTTRNVLANPSPTSKISKHHHARSEVKIRHKELSHAPSLFGHIDAEFNFKTLDSDHIREKEEKSEGFLPEIHKKSSETNELEKYVIQKSVSLIDNLPTIQLTAKGFIQKYFSSAEVEEAPKQEVTVPANLKKKFALSMPEYRPSLKRRVLKIISKLKVLKLDIEELIKYNPFRAKPYDRPNSKLFMNAVKDSSMLDVMKYVEQDKYIVYEYDYTRKTALHWAVLRGHIDIMEYLMKNHCDLDAVDMTSSTPLHLAVQRNDVNQCKLLISYGADLFIKCNLGLNSLEISKNEEITELIKSVQKVC